MVNGVGLLTDDNTPLSEVDLGTVFSSITLSDASDRNTDYVLIDTTPNITTEVVDEVSRYTKMLSTSCPFSDARVNPI